MISSLIVVKIQSNSDTSLACGREGPCHVMVQSITAVSPWTEPPCFISSGSRCLSASICLHFDWTLWASPPGLYHKSKHSRYILLETSQLSHPPSSQSLCFCMRVGFLFASHPKQGHNSAGYYPRAAQKGIGRGPLSSQLNLGCKIQDPCSLCGFLAAERKHECYQNTSRSLSVPRYLQGMLNNVVGTQEKGQKAGWCSCRRQALTQPQQELGA